MKWWQGLILGCLIFVITLVVYLPASFVTSFISLPGNAMLQGVTGSIWQGKAQKLQLDGVSITQLRWTLHPGKLFMGRVAINADAGQDGQSTVRVQGYGEYGLGGWLLKDVQGRAPASLIAPYVQAPVKVELDGVVSLNLAEIRSGQPWCDVADGKLVWNQAAMNNRFLKSALNLGDISAVLTCDENGLLNSHISDARGSLGLEADLQLKGDDTLSINAQLQPRGLPQDVEQGLGFVMDTVGPGQYRFNMDMQL